MKVLFIRRDNIGDLLCTTPAFRAVRAAHPGARIAVLANTYNAEVLRGNPDVDEVFAYEKAKHSGRRTPLPSWAGNARLLLDVRAARFDWAVGCGSASPRVARYAFLSGAARRAGYVGGRASAWFRAYTDPLPEPAGDLHEVERTFRLLAPLGVTGPPPPMRAVPDPENLAAVREALARSAAASGGPLVAFHVSSRRPENRWPAGRFVALGKALSGEGMRLLLLWSPGSAADARHPGDDEKAREIRDALGDRVVPFPTTRLRELVAALSVADAVVCGDGGAMHAAAALGVPVAAVWGRTDPARWRPWEVPHLLVGAPGGPAREVPPEPVAAAVRDLLGRRKPR